MEPVPSPITFSAVEVASGAAVPWRDAIQSAFEGRSSPEDFDLAISIGSAPSFGEETALGHTFSIRNDQALAEEAEDAKAE